MANPSTSDLPVLPIVCSELLPQPGMSRCARMLVTQEARIVLIIDCACRVQIAPPSAPDVFIAIDEDPADLGPNRMPFLSAPLPTNLVYPMEMSPGQHVVLATLKGTATCSVFITRLPDGGAL